MSHEKIHELQEIFFGNKYVGASLSKLTLDDKILGAISDWKIQPKRILLIYGPPGTGKTYICAAFIECPPKECRSFRAYNERKILERIRSQISEGFGDYIQNLHHLIDDDFIIIDDLGSSMANDWRREIVLEIIDYRYSKNLPTLITSNLDYNDFSSQYGQRVASRLFSDENVTINMKDMPNMRQGGRLKLSQQGN